MHVKEYNLGDAYFFLPIREYDNRCIYKYLVRTVYADSIVYRYARKQSIKTVYTDRTTLETYNDTLKSVVLANPGFDKLHGEPIVTDYSAYQMYMRNDEFRMKISPSRMNELYVGNGPCLSAIAGEGCLPEKRYIAGLGGPYYYCGGYVGDSEVRKLVYYKKGESEWGEKLVITGVSNFKTRDRLQVYPNPFTGEITVEYPGTENFTIEILNSGGQKVFVNNVSTRNRFQINLSVFPSGVYFVKAITGKKAMVQKIIKH